MCATNDPIETRPPRLSWGSMFRTCRGVVGLLAVTALGLIIPPQTADMLAGLSGQSGRDIWAGFAFHISLWLLAFNAWHWSRAVLSARFKVRDTHQTRTDPAKSLSPNPAFDDEALVLAPRVLFCAAAAIGVAAAMRSNAWIVVLIIVVWTALSIALLRSRLLIQSKLFKKSTRFKDGDLTTGPGGQAPKWIPNWLKRSWCTLDSVLNYAPLGRWVAAILLFFAALLFVLGAVESYLVDVTWLPTLPAVIGFWFPGPSAALLCLGLGIGPMTVLTFEADRFHWSGHILGIRWQLRRPPVFIILLAIILLTPTFINLHGVRVVPADTPGSLTPAQRKPLEEMLAAWADRCAKSQPVVRPIIVALSGGASRAGLWGARVLRAVDAKATAAGTAIFAISSVSGGSLGAAAYVAVLAGRPPDSPCTLGPADDSKLDDALEEALRGDALGPVLAGSLFGDIPRDLFGGPAYLARRASDWLRGETTHDMRGGDRAEALERAFEQNWSNAVLSAQLTAGAGRPVSLSKPYLSLFYVDGKPRGGVPIWIANGTDAQNGGRVLTVPFDPSKSRFAGTLDTLLLLGSDVPISTAITNTARFPFLNPAGELSPVTPDAKSLPTQLIDGGYFDNSGLLTAQDAARWLEQNGERVVGRPVKPILVLATADADRGVAENQIVRCGVPADDDPGRSIGGSRPIQFLAPLLGLYATRVGHANLMLREASAVYCPRHAFFHLYLYRKNEDVPLNWVLSQPMADYIWKDALQEGGNKAELDALGQALSVSQ